MDCEGIGLPIDGLEELQALNVIEVVVSEKHVIRLWNRGIEVIDFGNSGAGVDEHRHVVAQRDHE